MRKQAVCAILAALLLWGCAPAAQPASYTVVSEREYFTRGAQYGCAGIVMDVATLLAVPDTPEVVQSVVMICRNYAEVVTRAVWDAGIPSEQGEPPITVPLPIDPM